METHKSIPGGVTFMSCYSSDSDLGQRACFSSPRGKSRSPVNSIEMHWCKHSVRGEKGSELQCSALPQAPVSLDIWKFVHIGAFDTVFERRHLGSWLWLLFPSSVFVVTYLKESETSGFFIAFKNISRCSTLLTRRKWMGELADFWGCSQLHPKSRATSLMA